MHENKQQGQIENMFKHCFSHSSAPAPAPAPPAIHAQESPSFLLRAEMPSQGKRKNTLRGRLDWRVPQLGTAHGGEIHVQFIPLCGALRAPPQPAPFSILL